MAGAPKTGQARPRPQTLGRQRVSALTPTAAKSGNVAVRVEPTRAATQACVVVGIPLPVNYWVIHALQSGTVDALYDAELFDQSIVAYAAYESARDKLCGSTVNAIKNRVVDTSCGAQSGEFLISVTCAPSLASARKCAGVVFDNLRWGSLYSRYAQWCKAFGVIADKAAFSHAAEAANRATQGSIEIVITGKVDTDEEATARTSELLLRKVKDMPPKEGGRARRVELGHMDLPEGREEFLASNFRQRPAPGLSGVVVQNFVDINTRGSPSHLVSGTLFVPTRIDAGARRLATTTGPSGKAAKYASSLMSLGDKARGALVFIAAKKCATSSSQLVVSGTFTEVSAAGSIRSAFS